MCAIHAACLNFFANDYMYNYFKVAGLQLRLPIGKLRPVSCSSPLSHVLCSATALHI